MSKKSKSHRKKVAARNQRISNKRADPEKIINDIGKTGMATPNQAVTAGKLIASRGKNPVKVFQRKTGS